MAFGGSEIGEMFFLSKQELIRNHFNIICVNFVKENHNNMNIIEKRDYIHTNLYLLLDKDIDELFEKIKTHVEKEFVLSQQQTEEIEKRIERHKTGKSTSYSWQEVKDSLISKS